MRSGRMSWLCARFVGHDENTFGSQGRIGRQIFVDIDRQSGLLLWALQVFDIHYTLF